MAGLEHFNPPDAVKQWLRREDLETLSRAWEEAEATAVAWAEADGDEDAEMWEEPSTPSQMSMDAAPAPSGPSPQRAAAARPARRRKPGWNSNFHLLGKDTGAPAPRRRYFGGECAERSPCCPPSRLDAVESPTSRLPDLTQRPFQMGVRAPRQESSWVSTHQQTASVDNPGLHPHLRHYFDRRGYEASYRTRPELDKVSPVYRPRSPQRPGPEELVGRSGRSFSSPSFSLYDESGEVDIAARHNGNTFWGRRVLLYGQEVQAKPKRTPDLKRIPWVEDFQVQVCSDNEILNPAVRHYFDQEGLESSYRNRGHGHGRPKRTLFGFHPTPSNSQMSVQRSWCSDPLSQSSVSSGGLKRR